MKRIVLLLTVTLLITHSNNVSAQIAGSTPRDAAFDRKHIEDRAPIAYSYIREADVVWMKRIWRVIDLSERVNHPLYYPLSPTNNIRSLMQVILDALKAGLITAYDASSDEFLIPLTYNELIQTLDSEQTVTAPDPDNPQEMIEQTITIPFRVDQVKQFRIKEDWIFDKQRSVTEVRILGICPVTFETRGDDRLPKPLFWIYFPDARPVFASAEVFNWKNTTQRLSYDDLFHKRLFSSYIYKEDNVYDRLISEYLSGLDALLEAERIKNEMFLWETDLWEY